jgi:hypothetical protein
MKVLQAIAVKYKVALIVLLLLYAVVINVEQMRGSQRYSVTWVSINHVQPVKIMDCLTIMEGITEELRHEKVTEEYQFSKEKMFIFSKWLNCGVF